MRAGSRPDKLLHASRLYRPMRYLLLVLALAAALGAFFFLFDFLLGLSSSGPAHLLTSASDEGQGILMPSGVGLMTVLVSALTILLAIGAILLPIYRQQGLDHKTRRLTLAIGGVTALILLGAGLFLATSGLLGRDITYDGHQFDRSTALAGWLVVIASAFLFTVIVVVLKPRRLVTLGLTLALATPLLVLFTVCESALQPGADRANVAPLPTTDDLDVAELSTLQLFDYVAFRPSSPYEDQVTSLRRSDFPALGLGALTNERLLGYLVSDDPNVRSVAARELEASGATVIPLESGGIVVEINGVGRWMPGTTTSQVDSPPRRAVFQIRGAEHTAYLRTATGDLYRDGRWLQLDPLSLIYEKKTDIPTSLTALIESPPESLRAIPDARLIPSLLAGSGVPGAEGRTDLITVFPTARYIPAGIVPTSLHLRQVARDGTLRPFSATFSMEKHSSSYSWSSSVPALSEDQLTRARASSDPTYTQLPEDLPSRVTSLALEITSAHSGPYRRAKSIESYLVSRYTYSFADAGSDREQLPPGRDPIDWFLFDHPQGTAGTFSSAFVLLARAAGIPARVVSGWSIARTGGTQTVFTDQAHQWAEVAFEGLGWVAFEPTPGGPPVRTPQPVASITKLKLLIKDLFDEDPGIRRDAATALGSLRYPFAARYLLQALSDQNYDVRQAALESLNTIAAASDAVSVTWLESGGMVVDLDGLEWWIPGTTTAQVEPPPRRPLFEVRGAEHTAYLRTATGDLYRNGRWLQLDPLSLIYEEKTDIPGSLTAMIESPPEFLRAIPDARLIPSLLAGYDAAPLEAHTDVISVVSTSRYVPPGVVPSSLHPQEISSAGSLRPFSVTFYLGTASSSYSWSSTIPAFSEVQLARAEASSDSTYTQLPEGLPSRIGDLALEITSGHVGPYLKAKAIENYLRSQYLYSFADAGHDRDRSPPGRDPVDWFLFDHPQGTSGSFSSAFVLLARAAGIPARVVSGWAIARAGVPQTVFTDQAHQWAEVALEGVGWITFEPTPGGPPSRAPRTTISTPLVIQLIKDMFDEDPEVRKSAAEALGELGDPVAVEALVLAAIHDRRNDVRRAAAEALVRIDQAEARILLVEALSDEALNVRRTAAETLGWLGDRAAVTHLVDVTLYDDSHTVRLAAADALTELDTTGATKLLEDVLDEEDPDSRRAAAEALGFLGNRSAINRLAPVALYDDSEAARRAAIQSLNKLDRDGALELLLGELATDDPDSRAAAAETLGLLGNRAAIGPLLGVTLYDDIDGVRRAAANALNTLDQPGATDALLDTLTVDDPTVRKAAAEALGFLRNRATVRSLADVTLFDHDDSVRRAAADALNKIHRDIYQDPALEHLLDALASNDAPVRKAAAEALGFLGNRAAVGPLLDVTLYDEDDSVRQAAADALNEISRDGALGYLLDTLTDEDPTVRKAAAEALGFLGNRAAFDPLADVAIHDVDENVRQAAIEALTKIDRERAAEILIHALDDEDPTVRRASAQELGFLGNRAALHPLADVALYDGDETVRQAAVEALTKLDRGGATEILIQTLTDDETDSKEAASEALEDIGASVTDLGNGTSLVIDGELGYWIPGTTTAQTAGLPGNPIFEVRGAEHTAYLRTATGDVYEDGQWRQLDPVELRYTPPADLPGLVASAIDMPGGPFSSLAPVRIDRALLAQFTTAPAQQHTDVIHITPLGSLTAIPVGPAPTSLRLQSASLPGTFHPYSSTLSIESPVPGYSWTSRIAVYSQQQLARATVSPDPTYTQLPDDLPDRIRDLAISITRGLTDPYARARAIENYLSTRYPYRFADSEDDLVPPGRDPVDWFLFDHREGTCGLFSSAFVVLARSVGLPARVVSGWAIARTDGTQTVYTDQAHQWAEVAFDGLGWVTFEPTASGGPLDRVTADGPLQHSEGELVTADDPPQHSEPAPGPRDTVSEITRSPQQARKGFPFEIGGTVYTTSGTPVDGMEVEIFINEEKVNGGVKIGTGTTDNGRFEIEILVPTEFEGGSYQLIAHAIANSNFNESWSDPEISIYSGSEFELTGPTELPVDTEAVFQGKLFEETGNPLPGREIRVSIDGQRALSVVTNAAGSFEFSTTFSKPGRHQIEVDFGSDEFLLGNSARLAIDVTLPTRLAIDAPGQVAIGREFTVTGSLSDVRGESLSGKSIDLSVGGSMIDQVRTDSEGNFSLVHSIAADPGEYVVGAEFAGDGTILGSTDRVKVTAAAATVTVEEPEPVARGHAVTLRGVVTVGGELAPGEDIVLDGVQFGRTSAAGAFAIEYPVPFGAQLGLRELEVSVPGLDVSTTVGVQIDALSEMEMDAPSQVEVGREFAIEGTLRNLGGDPLGGRSIRVKVGEAVAQTTRTDPEGNFRVNHALEAPGEYEISGEFAGDGPVRHSTARSKVTAWFGTALTLEGPLRIGIGQEGTFYGRLTSSIGSHVGATDVRIEDPEGNLLTTVTPDEFGAFQFRRSFSESGPVTLTASLRSSSAWSASKSSLTVEVVTLTNLTIHSGRTALLGEPHSVWGALTGPNGEPIPGEPVNIKIAGRHWETLITGADGTFTLTPTFDTEAETAISAEFLGTEQLASSQASLRVVVGIPSLVIETPDPVARDGMAILRGSVVIGSELVPEVELTVNGESFGHSSRVGSFVIRYPIPGDHRLGTAEIELAAPALGASSVVPIQIKSATSLIVVPEGKVKLGERLLLEATLLNDQGQGISNVTLRIGSEVASATGPDGTALLELEAPAEPGLSTIPITVVFDGDDNYLPLSYTVGIPVTPGDFNWLLWIVVPLLVAGGVGAYWTGRRGMVPASGPETTARRPWYARAIAPAPAEKGLPATAPRDQAGEEEGEAEPDEPVKEPVATHLSIELRSDAEDLPNVWGANEEIGVICTLSDRQGRRIKGASVEVTTSGSAPPEQLRTGDEGSCAASTTAAPLGTHRASAEFGGDDDHLPAVAHTEYRIVDFREEIVRIYNDFLQWVRGRVPGASERSTPREIEVMIVGSGLQIDQRALEEIISRFEEADYSEHVITRRQYEAMYRAWRSAVGDRTGR